MGDINVDYLKPGKVLSNDIKDSYGRFLFVRGTKIENKHLRIMNDSRRSTVHLAEMVSNDPGLAATILKTINNAFYRLSAKIVSIFRAIALIGNNELNALVMGISAIRYFKNIPPEMVDMKKFRLYSVAAGIFARFLAHHKTGFAEETIYIAGLLHDSGRQQAERQVNEMMQIFLDQQDNDL